MLFAVLMGGKHPKAKIEVHDVVFAVADRLDQTYDQLRASWFGSPHSAHIDAWMEVEGVDGYCIEWSSEKPAPDEQRLYFLNFGGYEDGIFGEAHRYMFVVASDAPPQKKSVRNASARPGKSCTLTPSSTSMTAFPLHASPDNTSASHLDYTKKSLQ